MLNSAERTEKAEAQNKTHRAQQAAIVAGLQTILETDEQLLAFARGKIAGGWRGKFAIGLEAFFAPDVNVGLTERRFILQHISAVSGKPSEILPHFFPVTDIASLAFSDIETFGSDPAGRLVMRLQDEQHFRVKLSGKLNCEDAASMMEVFRSLTASRRKSGMTPTQSACPHCGHILDKPSKFCPYCGQTIAGEAAAPTPAFTDPLDTAAAVAAAKAEAADTVPMPESPAPPAPLENSSFAAAAVPAAEPPPYTALNDELFPEIPIAPDLLAATLPPIADTDEDGADGEDLFPEIPVSGSHESAPHTAFFTQSAESPETAEFDDTGLPSAGTAPAEYFTAQQNSGDAETSAAPSSEAENPAGAAEETPHPAASTAFWREFARISGVATPEVFGLDKEKTEPVPAQTKQTAEQNSDEQKEAKE